MPASVCRTIVEFSPLHRIHKLCGRSTAAVMNFCKQWRGQYFFYVMRCVRKKTVPVNESGSTVSIPHIERHRNDGSSDVRGYAGFRSAANHLITPVGLRRVGSVKTVGKVPPGKCSDRFQF